LLIKCGQVNILLVGGQMVKKLNVGYGLDNGLQGLYPLPILASRAPGAGDINYPIGSMWIRTTTDQAWILTSVAAGAATWALSSPGSSDVDTLTGDGGGAISPAGGNITLAGGTNITSAGAGNTITFNLDPAIVLATSITSPLYTAAAALNLFAAAGQNVVIKMGDAAGANKVSFVDSTAAEVFALNSVGTLSMAALTVTGAFTQTGGIVNMGTDAAANAINIGTGAAAKPIIIGNGSGATAVTLNAGTGGVNVGTNAIAHTVTIGNVTGTTAVNINAGTAGSTYTTTNGAFALNTGTGSIGIGTDAAAKTVTIGNATGASSVVVNGGTGAMQFGANAIAHATTVGSTTGAAASTLQAGTGLLAVNGGGIVEVDSVGVLELNSSAGVIGIGNDAVAQAINIGTGAAARTVTIGNTSAASSVIVDVGTGDADFGVSAFAHRTRVGSTTGASASTLQAGTGLLHVNGGAIVEVDSVGVLELNSSGGVIGIGNDAVAQNINIGTGAAPRTITIGNGSGATSVVIDNGTGALNVGTNATVHTTTVGSTAGASATVIQSGTGKITVTGTVHDMTADFVRVSGDAITFRASPIAQSTLDTCVIPTGVAATTDLLAFENGMIMEQFVIGTQTILAPRMAAAGLTVSCDLTNAEGKEYNFGAARANSKHSFTIGTSPAFYMQLRFSALDVSALEPAYFGFRKTQANNAAYGAYTDFVAYGLNDGVAPGDCAISTRLNSGAQVDTDTNDAFADASTHTLTINVSAAGVVTFLFDGAPPTVTQAFTFDNGDVVHPFWTHLFNATAGAGDEIYWISMEVGYQ
jgi:hypothetical protein